MGAASEATVDRALLLEGSRRRSSWPALRRARPLFRSWQAEAAITARRDPPSWLVASEAALNKVNGPVLVEPISFSLAGLAAWRRAGLPAAES